MFQKVTQKVWFVVLVGLLLGLACGVVMARWPGLRGVAAGVAVVGALLLGRVVGVVWSIVGAVRRRRKATEKPESHELRHLHEGVNRSVAASIDLDSKQLRFVDNEKPATEGKETLFELMQKLKASRRRIKLMEPLWAEIERISKLSDDELTATRPDGGCEHANCAVECAERNRNASVSKGPVYARIATPEDTRIERLAVLLHNAGRAAVEPSGTFVEWDDTPERTRAGRRSQAAYLLAAGVGLPGDSALDRIAADVAELRRLAQTDMAIAQPLAAALQAKMAAEPTPPDSSAQPVQRLDAQPEKGRESYAEPRIVKGGGGDYFVGIRSGLWRIEADGVIGCDAESRAGFCELLAEIVSANQTKIASKRQIER